MPFAECYSSKRKQLFRKKKVVELIQSTVNNPPQAEVQVLKVPVPEITSNATISRVGKKNRPADLDVVSINPVLKTGLTSSSSESESVTAHYSKTASFQEIIPLWQDYFTKLRTSSNFLESAIIDPSNVSFDGEIITLVLSSSTQEQQWAQLKAKLIPFLQEKLNATIPIINIDVQRTQVDVKPYTTQERFKALLEKNPNVLILIKKLNLEPDHS